MIAATIAGSLSVGYLHRYRACRIQRRSAFGWLIPGFCRLFQHPESSAAPHFSTTFCQVVGMQMEVLTRLRWTSCTQPSPPASDSGENTMRKLHVANKLAIEYCYPGSYASTLLVFLQHKLLRGSRTRLASSLANASSFSWTPNLAQKSFSPASPHLSNPSSCPTVLEPKSTSRFSSAASTASERGC